ncbi:MAG TPA: dihydrodipicolinate reductase [Anaeromyxobacteraceae bacterium]|nr:dihydrodipicolinate reductase [Anaeromyxobacteraceae bacterium]
MGLGEVGRAIAVAAFSRPDLRVVGAVDPAHAGRTLADLLGGQGPAVPIVPDLRKVLGAAKGGVLLHATDSRLEAVLPQLEAAVRGGLHVVSTCEELAFPWASDEGRADALDRLANDRNVAVLGTGVNPGFVLDRLPALLSQATGPVRHLRATRVVELAGRRPGLLRRAGVGLTEEAFWDAEERGVVGHVGLGESAWLAADGCGIGLDELEVDEEIEPILADEDVAGPLPLRRGQVAGLRQAARAFVDGREVVRLELLLQVAADDPRDEVDLDADPRVRVVVPGGLPGDRATAHIVVNAVPALVELRGLVTVLNLPAGR